MLNIYNQFIIISCYYSTLLKQKYLFLIYKYGKKLGEKTAKNN